MYNKKFNSQTTSDLKNNNRNARNDYNLKISDYKQCVSSDK